MLRDVGKNNGRQLVKYTTEPGGVSVDALVFGELALNTSDGSIHFKKNDGTDAVFIAAAGEGSGVLSVAADVGLLSTDDGEGNVTISVDTANLTTQWANITGKPAFATVATSGAYADLSGTPSVPTAVSELTNDSGYVTLVQAAGAAPVQTVSAGTNIAASIASGVLSITNTAPAQENADWDSTGGVSQILNKPALSTVATTGAYTDLSGKPAIPTLVSELTNDALYVNAAGASNAAPVQSVVAGTNVTVSDDGNGNVTVNSTASGSSTYQRIPLITASPNPDPVDQGQTWAVSLTGTGYPGLVWSFYDYTGTPFTYSPTSNTGLVAGIENTPGTYTVKARCGWAGGWSDEATLTIQVNPFTLTRDTAFGGVDGLQAWYNLSSTAADDYVPYTGAVVDDGGTYRFDNGSLVADTANCVAFWSFTADILVAFRYNSSGTLESPKYWTGITTAPVQGNSLPGGGSTYTSTSTQNTTMNNSSINGKRVPNAAYYNGGLGSSHYLEMTPGVAGDFDGFGARDTSWSYGFTLTDDWVTSGTGNQMLSPTGTDYNVQAIAGYGIGSSPYEYILYGDNDSGVFSTSTNGATWDASTNGWLIGSAGDHVVVTWDQTTWRIYVEGTLIYSNNSPSTYMTATTSPTAIRFGDVGGSNQGTYPIDEPDLGGWFARLDNIWLDIGTALSQAQVTSITSFKNSIQTSPEYASIDHLWLLDGSGVTVEKGGSSIARGDISFA